MITSKLNQILVVKQLITSATTEGLSVNYFKTIKKISASITNQRGNLDFDSSYLGETYADSISFYCRYHHDLAKKNKKELLIEHECKEYEIKNITVVPRNAAMIIDCTGVR